MLKQNNNNNKQEEKKRAEPWILYVSKFLKEFSEHVRIPELIFANILRQLKTVLSFIIDTMSVKKANEVTKKETQPRKELFSQLNH
jgi:hypothetical protein